MSDYSATKTAIIDAAERLWAAQGIEGASLRQIGAAAGCGNASAVQYHFQNKAGLIRALYRTRIAVLERERQALLEELQGTSPSPAVVDIANALFRPVANLRDSEGRHAFAGFQLNIARHNQLTLRFDLLIPAPATENLTTMLRNSLPHLSEEQMSRRLAWSSITFWFGLVSIDQQMWASQQSGRDEGALVDELLRLTAEVLSAPA